MKNFSARVLVFAFIWFIEIFVPAQGQQVEYANRKWFEYNRTLYRIDVDREYTWKDAMVECKKMRMQLIKPASNNHELQEFIKSKFSVFPSFWAQNNVTAKSILEKIGFKKSLKNGKACNKIDHKTMEIRAEECHQYLGFICEIPLETSAVTYNIKNQKYSIEPEAKYFCGQARDRCQSENMTLLEINAFRENTLLSDYVLLKYGFRPSFWFSKSNQTNECIAWSRSQVQGPLLGAICYTTITKPALSFRHLVFICFLSSCLFIGIIGLIIFKFCFNRAKFELSAAKDRKMSAPGI